MEDSTVSESLEQTIKHLHTALKTTEVDSTLEMLIAKILLKIENPVIRRQAVAAINGSGDASFHYAARVPKGNSCKNELILKLVNEGDDVNVENKKLQTPFSIAMQMEDYETVKMLLDQGALPHLYPSQIENDPFCRVVRENSIHEFEGYIKRGAPVNIICKDTGNNLLHILIEEKRSRSIPDKVDLQFQFLKSGAVVHLNLNMGNNGMVTQLVMHGVDVNSTNKSGTTPLYYAVLLHKTIIVEELLTNKIDIDNVSNKNAFMLAFTRDSRTERTNRQISLRKKWKKAIANFFKVGFVDHTLTGKTFFQMSSLDRYFDFVKDMVKSGQVVNVDCDTEDSKAEISNVPSSLPYSKSLSENQERFKTLEDLLQYGANVNLQNEIGNTLLHMQSDSEHIGVLIRFDVDLNVKNKEGETALQRAMDAALIDRSFRHGFANVRLLIEYGADINLLKGIDLPSRRGEYVSKTNNLLAKHICKMLAVNLPIKHPKLQINLAKTHFHNFLRLKGLSFLDVIKKIVNEKVCMKNTYIADSKVTYYTLLTTPTHHDILRILRNENISETLKAEEYKNMFPECSYMIFGAIRTGRQRQRLYQLITDNRHLIWPQLIDDSVEEILSYLNNIDLRSFVHAFVPHKMLTEVYSRDIKECTRKLLIDSGNLLSPV